VTGPGLISSCGGAGPGSSGTPATLLAWHRKLAAGTYDTPRITATHLGAQPNHRKPVLGGLASEYSPGRVTLAKVQRSRFAGVNGGRHHYRVTMVGGSPWSTGSRGSRRNRRLT
jgi:hypothetical protein